MPPALMLAISRLTRNHKPSVIPIKMGIYIFLTLKSGD